MSYKCRRDWKMIKRFAHLLGNAIPAFFGLLSSACCLLSVALATTPASAELKPDAGQDLIVNGGFEDPGDRRAPAGWTNNAKNDAKKIKKSGGKNSHPVDFLWSDHQPHSGKRCIGITSSYSEKKPGFIWEQNIDGLKAGETYRLSAWVRSEVQLPGVNTSLGLRFSDAGGQVIENASQPLKNIHQAGARWSEVTQEIVVPIGTASARVVLAMHGPGSVWLDDVHLLRAAGPAAQPMEAARIYPVIDAPHPIVLDGRTGDWNAAPRVNVGKAVEVSFAEDEFLERTLSKGDKDLSFAFALQNDGTDLCVLAEVRDDVIYPATPYWQGDSIQLAIDTTFARSRSGYPPGLYTLGVALTKDAAQAVSARAMIDHVPDGSRLSAKDIGLGFAKTPDGYTVELAIPWKQLGIDAPGRNQRLGFTIVVNDSDGSGVKSMEWRPGLAKNLRPADFGTLLLMGKGNLGLSLVGPIEPASDAQPLNLVAWLVSTAGKAHAAKAQTVPVTLTIDSAPVASGQRREVPVAPGAIQLLFPFEPGSIAPGKHRAVATAGTLSSEWPFEVKPIRAMAAESEGRLLAIKERAAVLSELVSQGRKASVDVALPDVTLATAELYVPWISADMKRSGAEILARRETERLAPLIEIAIAEMQQTLAHPQEHPLLAPPDVMAAQVRNGGWYVDDRPVFLFGINQVDYDYLPILPRLGCNAVDAHAGGPKTIFPRGREVNEELFQRASESIRRAAALGLRSNAPFHHKMPDWLMEQFPDILGGEGHFMEYDIDHPEARKLTLAALEAIGKHTAGEPGVFAYELWNEANYEGLSNRGLVNFRQDMRTRYGSIAKLNEAWGSKYSDFDKVKPVARDPAQAAAYTDWCRWNDARVTEFVAAMRQAVLRGNPKALVHVKIPNEIGFEGSRTKNGQAQTVSGHYRGLDRWALAQALDIQGCDTRPLILSDNYGMAFPLPLMCYDLQRSFTPAKPIYDSEWHGIQTAYYQNDDLPGEFLRAALWLSYLHGMDANVTWSWAREGVGPKTQNVKQKKKQASKKKREGSNASKGTDSPYFTGSLVTQPQLLDAWGRNSITVQRHASEIVAFQDDAPRVRLLFSKPSAILDVKHLDAMQEAYENLDWLGIPIGFVSEEMLLAGFRDCDLLIVPAARNASPGVREAVAKLSNGGVRVVFIGEECLAQTPQGRPMDKPASVKADLLRSAQDIKAFQAAMNSAGVKQFVRCIGPDGLSSKPVEFRTVEYRGRHLGYYVNVGKAAAVIHNQMHGQPARWRSLLTGQRCESAVELKPYELDLFVFE
jgi:beta-galactosidase